MDQDSVVEVQSGTPDGETDTDGRRFLLARDRLLSVSSSLIEDVL